jgi:hypothetical protein
MINSSLEKVFFNYILNNRKFFELVKPYFLETLKFSLFMVLYENT